MPMIRSIAKSVSIIFKVIFGLSAVLFAVLVLLFLYSFSGGGSAGVIVVVLFGGTIIVGLIKGFIRFLDWVSGSRNS